MFGFNIWVWFDLQSHRSYTSSPIRSASAFGFFEQNDEEINGKNCGKLLANKDFNISFQYFYPFVNCKLLLQFDIV